MLITPTKQIFLINNFNLDEKSIIDPFQEIYRKRRNCINF